MNTAEEYFMAVVREKSIARAAEKLYLSQQNLSNSIKRLEQRYGVLFWRKPHFCLTAEGEVLYRTLQQIQVLENNLSAELLEIKNEDSGKIRFGIPSTRARVLVPRLMERFRQQFSRTQLEFTLEDTEQLEALLLCGELDLMLGIDAEPHPELLRSASWKETIYLAVSKQLLKSLGIETCLWERLAELPFLLNPPVSHLRQKIDLYFKRRFIAPRHSTVVGDFELQMILAAQGEGACFCTQIMLPKMQDMNQTLPPDRRLIAFPIQDETIFSTLAIVRHRYGADSQALKTFSRILAEEIEGMAEGF